MTQKSTFFLESPNFQSGMFVGWQVAYELSSRAATHVPLSEERTLRIRLEVGGEK